MPGQNAHVDKLLERARGGDRTARERLLTQHRARLRKVIAVRMDPRLTVRVDPSDVVQETLMEAARRLSDFLQQEAIPFYPCPRKSLEEDSSDSNRTSPPSSPRAFASRECSSAAERRFSSVPWPGCE